MFKELYNKVLSIQNCVANLSGQLSYINSEAASSKMKAVTLRDSGVAAATAIEAKVNCPSLPDIHYVLIFYKLNNLKIINMT
jgi:hypothetical protein